MIGIMFDQVGEVIEIRIDGNNIYFRTSQTGGQYATIENLQISKSGCIKEHPDLKGRDDWHEESIKRFKQKVSSYDTEKEKAAYLIQDLKKYGFKPTHYQEAGHRVVKLE